MSPIIIVKLLLGGSVALNLCLVLALVSQRQHQNREGMHPHRPALAAPEIERRSVERKLAAFAAASTAHEERLTEQLRGLGVGPSVIHAVLIAHIRDQFAVAREELFRSHKVPFWRRQSPPLEMREQLRQLELTRDQLLAETESLAGGVSEEERLERMAKFGAIDPAKFARLRQLEAEYQLKIQQTSQRHRNPQEIRAAIELLEQSHDKELIATLAPEEYAEHQKRNSSSAQRLADSLSEVDIDESEYEALFALQEKYDEKERPQPGRNALTSHEAAVSEFFDQGRAVLGDPRFKKLFSARDAAFGSYVRFVETHPPLKLDAAFDLYALEREMRAKYAAMEAMPPERLAKEIRVAAAEIIRRLSDILGADRAATFSSSVNAGVLKLILFRAAQRPKDQP